MRTRYSGALIPVAAVAASVIILLLVVVNTTWGQIAAGRFPAYRPARMADGHSDLNGIWQAFVTANVDLSVIPELRALWGYYRDRRPEMYGPVVKQRVSSGCSLPAS